MLVRSRDQKVLGKIGEASANSSSCGPHDALQRKNNYENVQMKTSLANFVASSVLFKDMAFLALR